MEIPAFPGDMGALYPWLVFMLATSTIFASLTRSRLFDSQKPARAIISIVLGFMVGSSFDPEQWGNVVSVAGWAVTAGMVTLLVWRVGLQRGRTKEEEEFRREKERQRAEKK